MRSSLLVYTASVVIVLCLVGGPIVLLVSAAAGVSTLAGWSAAPLAHSVAGVLVGVVASFVVPALWYRFAPSLSAS